MRLLVVSQYFWPEDFRINELVAELMRRGHEVTVLTGKPNYPSGVVDPEFAQNPHRFSRYEGARILRVPMLARGQGKLRLLLNYLSYAASATLFGILRLRGEVLDAIFVFEPSPVTVGLPAVALRAVKGWPIAFWVLDQWPETLAAIGMVTSKTGISAVGRLVSFIYSRCDVILSPSKSLMPRIRRYSGDARVEYFPNWSEAIYSASSIEPATEVAVRPGTFNVVFAGNIGEAQDFPTILDAAERLKARDDIRWLVVGDGRMAPWVRAEVAKRGLDERVVLLGRHAPARMPSFFTHASALLVSLKSDPVFSMTAPGKIQSYLAFGVPVLGMLDGEGATVIEDARAGLTCPAGNAAMLAQCVESLAAMDVVDRASMGARGAAYAQKEFGRDLLIGKLELLLSEMAHHPRRT
ncbi:MAG: glycosyltransferase family 4 protein [Gemmatimonadaceae bacterium]